MLRFFKKTCSCLGYLLNSNPIQCDMTGAGGASLPASRTTIYYIQTGRPLAPVPVKSQS